MTEFKNMNPGKQFGMLAERERDRTALVLTDSTFTYGMLWALTKTFYIRMSNLGIDKSSTLQVVSRDLSVVLATAYASALLGARLAETSLSKTLKTPFPITHVFCDATEDDCPVGAIKIDEDWSPANHPEIREQSASAFNDQDEDAIWLLLTTSGTTGLPKVVGLTMKTVTLRSAALRDEFKAGETRLAMLFPYGGRPFFARAFGALANGAILVDRGDWAFWRACGVTQVSGSVAQVKTLVENLPAAGKIKTVEVMGSKLVPANAEAFLKHFEVLDDTYGATETSKSYSTIYQKDTSGKLQRHPMPRGSEIEITDNCGEVVQAGTAGEVRVRNPYYADGYLSKDAGQTDVMHDGWFYPGDTARWATDGSLEILGRTNADILQFDGVKIDAAVIDSILASVDGIQGAISFQSPKDQSTDVLAFVVFKEGYNRPQTVEMAKKTCRDTFGALVSPSTIRPINMIPRQSDGSPDRRKCAKMILAASQASPRT